MCFCANQSSSNASIMDLPKFNYALLVRHSFLDYCIGDNLHYLCYGFSARLSECSVSGGAFLLGMLPNMFKVAGSKETITD